MSDFFQGQLDYIFFFYGLSFIILSVICLSIKKVEEDRLPWGLLGLFGILHGLNEWLDLIALSFVDNPIFIAARLIILAVSFLFMFEFARRAWSNLSGRAPGIWIYLPLIMFSAAGGMYGTAGLNASVRYCLAFTACSFAAWSFYKASQLESGNCRRLLIAMSALMGMYAIATGLVVPQSGLPLSSILNYETFGEFLGCPVQLVRGILASLLAAVIWLYSLEKEKSLHELRRDTMLRSILGRAIVAVLFTAIIIGWLFTDYMGKHARKELAKDSEKSAIILYKHISDDLLRVDQLASVMSSSPWVAEALIKKTTLHIERVNNVLDRYARASNYAVCYLLDTKGKTIASSNRHTPESFVGKNYAFRPYFRQALTEGMGRHFAFGITSRERGYYAASAVTDPAGMVIGAAVIKSNIAVLEVDFRLYSNAFLVSPEGVIFLSSRSEFLFASLWPISEADASQLRASRQFGDISFKSIMERELINDSYEAYDGKEFHVIRKYVGEEGWSVVLLSPTLIIAERRFGSILISLVVCLMIVAFAGILIKREQLNRSTMRLLALAEEQRFIIEHINDVVYRCDNTRAFTYISQAIERITGYTADEWKKVHTACLTDNPLNKKAMEYMSTVPAADSGGFQYKVEMFNKDGRVITLEIDEQLYFEDGKLAGIVGIARDITERVKAEEEFKKAATFDRLTGILNRQAFEGIMQTEIARTERYGSPLSLIMFDIDHFKEVNDIFGHQIGDYVLKAIADIVSDNIRAADSLGRWGGEEFMVLVPETDLQEAAYFAEKLRGLISGYLFEKVGKVTASFGVSRYIMGNSMDGLIKSTDDMLYFAKNSGRDQVKAMSENNGSTLST